MCSGPSATEENLQNEQAAFYQNQISAYNTAYQNFSQIQNLLKAQFEPIIQAGPGQFGYTPQEATALRTQATEGTATAYAAAQRALNQTMAGRGGGTDLTNITGAGATQLSEELAAASAATQAQQQLGITTTGYDIGRQQYQQAVAGEEGLASGWNPNAFGATANTGGQGAFNMASTIVQQQQAPWNAVIGALGGIAGQAAGGWMAGGGGGGGGSLADAAAAGASEGWGASNEGWA